MSDTPKQDSWTKAGILVVGIALGVGGVVLMGAMGDPTVVTIKAPVFTDDWSTVCLLNQPHQYDVQVTVCSKVLSGPGSGTCQDVRLSNVALAQSELDNLAAYFKQAVIQAGLNPGD